MTADYLISQNVTSEIFMNDHDAISEHFDKQVKIKMLSTSEIFNNFNWDFLHLPGYGKRMKSEA